MTYKFPFIDPATMSTIGGQEWARELNQRGESLLALGRRLGIAPAWETTDADWGQEDTADVF